MLLNNCCRACFAIARGTTRRRPGSPITLKALVPSLSFHRRRNVSCGFSRKVHLPDHSSSRGAVPDEPSIPTLTPRQGAVGDSRFVCRSRLQNWPLRGAFLREQSGIQRAAAGTLGFNGKARSGRPPWRSRQSRSIRSGGAPPCDDCLGSGPYGDIAAACQEADSQGRSLGRLPSTRTS